LRGFVQYKLFALRSLPLSILQAGIVGLLFGNDKGRIKRKQVGWLLRFKKLRCRVRLHELVVAALRLFTRRGGENAASFRTPRPREGSRGWGNGYFRKGNQ